MKLIYVATKYLIISICATFTTQLFLLSIAVDSFSSSEIKNIDAFNHIFKSIDCIMNSLCIYMNLHHGKCVYEILCHKIHYCCQWCFIKLVC